MQNVTPYLVATSMSRIQTTSFFIPGPDKCVRSAVDAIGIQKSTYGYWTHALMVYLQQKIVNVAPCVCIIVVLFSFFTGLPY